jgi:hypothetical protein
VVDFPAMGSRHLALQSPMSAYLNFLEAQTQALSYSVVNFFIGLVTPSLLPLESIDSTL